jgi:hypothetical protein
MQKPKALALFALAAILTVVSTPLLGQTGPAPRISLRVSNGWSLVSPLEYNDFLADYPRSYDDVVGVGISSLVTKPVRWAQDFEIAADIPLRRGLALTVAAGLLAASSEGNAFTVEWGTVSEEFLRDDRIRAVFARLGLASILPLGKSIELRPHAGLDAYWASFEDAGSRTSYYHTGGEEPVQSWAADTNGFSLGWTAGLELDWAVLGKLMLCLDAGYRRARLSNFSGRYQESYYGVPDEARDFRLLYFEEEVDWLATTYKRFNLPGGWSGGLITAVHDAVIDLSGFYLRAGLRVSF